MEHKAKVNPIFLKSELRKGNVVFDDQVKGLMGEPNTSGGKWTLRFTNKALGKRRHMGLGSYPEVSLAKARDKAWECRRLIAEGIDPIDHRNQSEAAKENGLAIPTFEQAALLAHTDFKPGWKNAKHAAQWITTLRTYVFPALGSKALPEITPYDCAEALRPIWLTKLETASRTKQRMHAVFDWALAHGHIHSNPVDVVNHLLPKQDSSAKEHQPAMPWRDCPAFIAEHLRKRTVTDTVKAALEFIILTGVRFGDVQGMTWDEVAFDAKVWSIPARTKTKVPHRVPLSDRALEILAQQRAANLHPILVFPSARGLKLSDMALTALLRRVEAKSDIPGRTATVHGFRSSFRDWASENGHAYDYAERALAHKVKSKVEAAYHRTDLLEQRRPMMNEWASMCGALALSGN